MASAAIGLWLSGVLVWGCRDAPSAPATAPSAVPTAAPTTDDPFEARRQALFGEVRELVASLTAAGRYDCCTKSPCSHCALLAAGCKCGEGLRRGEPVCEECAHLWTKGQGDEPGVDPAQVRSFLEAEKAMMIDGGRACACEAR
jgi:hypothetical protein